MSNSHKIAIIWDFDGTLTPQCSTTETANFLTDNDSKEFWEMFCAIKGKDFWSKIETIKKQGNSNGLDMMKTIIASDAPTWMYTLSKIAAHNRVPLNSEFFQQYIVDKIKLFPKVRDCMRWLKDFSKKPSFQELNIQVHNFIVSAGLEDLVSEIFPGKELFTEIFGCRYNITYFKDKEMPESVPIFCMDETMKTRVIFNISKGFKKGKIPTVNKRVETKNLWCPFENMIYIGDGPTDIPALSLVRSRGGIGIVVFNPEEHRKTIRDKLSNMSLDKRADLITKADFSSNKSQLRSFIEMRLLQILHKYQAGNLELSLK